FAALPIFQRTRPATDRRRVIASVIAGPCRGQRAPSRVVQLPDMSQNRGVREKLLRLLGERRVIQTLLVCLSANEIHGEIVDAGDVVRTVAAMRTALHPDRKRRTQRLARTG